MSKKKNTLSDLEEFLKLQASSLVTPPTLTEKVKTEEKPAPVSQSPVVLKEATPTVITESDVANALRQIGQKDKRAFYQLIISTTKDLPNYSTEDALLINTALYLKGGSNWKEVVREYWKKN